MVDVTATAEEVVDFWPYAQEALKVAFPSACSCDWNVKHIYESPDGLSQQALIPSDVSDLYIVIVIDKEHRRILGYHKLDLGALYGLREETAALH